MLGDMAVRATQLVKEDSGKTVKVLEALSPHPLSHRSSRIRLNVLARFLTAFLNPA
jgi:hypothetical protein